MIYHHPHPLMSCYIPEKEKNSQSWKNKKCKCCYFYNAPSYYCTACDYNLCQNV